MTQTYHSDPKSVAGKPITPAERTDVLVIGSGPAGLAAAIEATTAGLSVVLVDENPVDFRSMGDDVPLHFGRAMTGVVRNRNAMMEAVLAIEPDIEAAMEAGADVRLSTIAWGIFRNGAGVATFPGTIVGLAAGNESSLVQADRVVVAAGRRDMGLAFPGWETPGVLGATAALSLARRYQALSPRRIVVLGSSTEALETVRELMAIGVEIAAVVEQSDHPIGSAELLEMLKTADVRLLLRHVVRAVNGCEAVRSVTVTPIGASGIDAGDAEEIACDGVILAIAAVPVVDILDAAGCAIAFQPDRGGFAPTVDHNQRTSAPDIYAVGDCAGVWAGKTRDPEIARAEGQRAARAIAASLGRNPDGNRTPLSLYIPNAAETDVSAYRLAWVRASVVEARTDCTVCQCEEVSAREILEVRPPRYLGCELERRNDRSLASLLGEGPPDPDQVKRLTRAGMGACQGRRCREQVAALLALGAAIPLNAIRLANHRAPVRPLSLAILGGLPEHPAQIEHWDSWFGMKAQWRPFWDVPPLFRVGDDDTSFELASE